MSDYTYGQVEVMARRFLDSYHARSDEMDFEIAIGKVMDALEIIDRCQGHISFIPPISPIGGVYGEEKIRNWLTGWLR